MGHAHNQIVSAKTYGRDFGPLAVDAAEDSALAVMILGKTRQESPRTDEDTT